VRRLLDRLNSLSEQCAEDAIETYRGFSNPSWESLNPKQHVDLIAKLLRYRQVGARVYFDPSVAHSASDTLEGAAYLRRAMAFVEGGGTLRVWRTRLVPTFYGKSAAAGQQTIILLQSYIGSAIQKKCPGERSKGWVSSLFVVTPGLSGPSPEIDPGNAGILYWRTVLLHNGISYLVNSDTVFRGFGDAGLQEVCSFSHDKGNEEVLK
jgi:hypothetical protein